MEIFENDTGKERCGNASDAQQPEDHDTDEEATGQDAKDNINDIS